MASDLGTLSIRVAQRSTSSNNEKPSVIINREDSRATPRHILFYIDGSFVTGTLASSKFYERSNSNTPVGNVGRLDRYGSQDDACAAQSLIMERKKWAA